MKFPLIRVASLAFIVLFMGVADAFSQDTTSIDRNLTSVLKQTEVTAYLDYPITTGKNLIFCAAFQMAWNELRDHILKEDAKFPNNPKTLQMLNKKSVRKDILDAKDYVAMAGFGKDNIVQKINEALKQRFNDGAPLLTEEVKENDAMAYAFLFKNLTFKNPFERLDTPIHFPSTNGITTPVSSFGINKMDKSESHLKVARQVKILFYEGSFKFAISLESQSTGDELILARIDPGATLLETIKALDGPRKGKTSAKLRDEESLRIPLIDFSVIHHYEDLVGWLTNAAPNDFRIAEAVQTVRFKLNEQGALLKSEGIIMLMAEGDTARNFVFDGPFLLLMRKKGQALPYFALWVENSELLLPIN